MNQILRAAGSGSARDGPAARLPHPGDVINTGTPSGVALGRAGEPYLRAGDIVDVEIGGLGRRRQTLEQA